MNVRAQYVAKHIMPSYLGYFQVVKRTRRHTYVRTREVSLMSNLPRRSTPWAISSCQGKRKAGKGIPAFAYYLNDFRCFRADNSVARYIRASRPRLSFLIFISPLSPTVPLPVRLCKSILNRERLDPAPRQTPNLSLVPRNSRAAFGFSCILRARALRVETETEREFTFRFLHRCTSRRNRWLGVPRRNGPIH